MPDADGSCSKTILPIALAVAFRGALAASLDIRAICPVKLMSDGYKTVDAWLVATNAFLFVCSPEGTILRHFGWENVTCLHWHASLKVAAWICEDGLDLVVSAAADPLLPSSSMQQQPSTGSSGASGPRSSSGITGTKSLVDRVRDSSFFTKKKREDDAAKKSAGASVHSPPPQNQDSDDGGSLPVETFPNSLYELCMWCTALSTSRYRHGITRSQFRMLTHTTQHLNAWEQYRITAPSGGFAIHVPLVRRECETLRSTNFDRDAAMKRYHLDQKPHGSRSAFRPSHLGRAPSISEPSVGVYLAGEGILFDEAGRMSDAWTEVQGDLSPAGATSPTFEPGSALRPGSGSMDIAVVAATVSPVVQVVVPPCDDEDVPQGTWSVMADGTPADVAGDGDFIVVDGPQSRRDWGASVPPTSSGASAQQVAEEQLRWYETQYRAVVRENTELRKEVDDLHQLLMQRSDAAAAAVGGIGIPTSFLQPTRHRLLF